MSFTPKFTARFWNAVERRGPDECWLWKKAVNKKGYGVVRCDGRLWRSNRVALILAGGVLQPGEGALHTCDVRHCCNPAHLFAGTDLDNQRDCIAKGRAVKAIGERVGSAKMTDTKVLQARAMYSDPAWTHRKLAAHFGVSKTAMGCVLNGEHWQHVIEITVTPFQ